MRTMNTRRARTMRTRCGKQTRAGGEHDEEENGLNVKTISSTRTIAYRAVRVGTKMRNAPPVFFSRLIVSASIDSVCLAVATSTARRSRSRRASEASSSRGSAASASGVMSPATTAARRSAFARKPNLSRVVEAVCYVRTARRGS